MNDDNPEGHPNFKVIIHGDDGRFYAIDEGQLEPFEIHQGDEDYTEAKNLVDRGVTHASWKSASKLIFNGVHLLNIKKFRKPNED